MLGRALDVIEDVNDLILASRSRRETTSSRRSRHRGRIPACVRAREQAYLKLPPCSELRHFVELGVGLHENAASL